MRKKTESKEALDSSSFWPYLGWTGSRRMDLPRQFEFSLQMEGPGYFVTLARE